jgi:hypothetical protein
MNPKVAIVAGFAVAVALILFLTMGGKDKPEEGRDPRPGAANTEGPAKPGTEISMLYSSEKKDWVLSAAGEFAKVHPEIKLSLKEKGSLSAVEDILDGKEKPTIFSPADTLVMNLLVTDWDLKYHTELVAKGGEDAPQPLVITPLVFVIWEGRAAVLERRAGARSTGRRSTTRWPRTRAGRRSAGRRSGVLSS